MLGSSGGERTGSKRKKIHKQKLKLLSLQKKPVCEEVTVMFGENLKLTHYFTKVRRTVVTVL